MPSIASGRLVVSSREVTALSEERLGGVSSASYVLVSAYCGAVLFRTILTPASVLYYSNHLSFIIISNSSSSSSSSSSNIISLSSFQLVSVAAVAAAVAVVAATSLACPRSSLYL